MSLTRRTSRKLDKPDLDKIDDVKASIDQLARLIEETAPDNYWREQALLKLEEAAMWATKSISA